MEYLTQWQAVEARLQAPENQFLDDPDVDWGEQDVFQEPQGWDTSEDPWEGDDEEDEDDELEDEDFEDEDFDDEDFEDEDFDDEDEDYEDYDEDDDWD